MKFLVTSIGSSGDINPFIAVALALRERGHEVVFLVNPYFESTVRAQGLVFAPLGEYLSPADVARNTPLAFSRLLGPIVIMRRWFVPFFRPSLEAYTSAIAAHRPHAVVGHQISFTLPWAARRAGIPWITCPLAPATILSIHDPPRMPVGADLRRMPLWYRRFAHATSRRIVSLLIDPELNRMRRELGMPSRYDALFGEMLEEPDATLALWSAHFRPPAPDDPPRLQLCGFPWFDRKSQYAERGERLAPELERFLDAGDPPVVFTLGSVLSHTGAGVYRAAADACRRLGVRAVLVVGRDSSIPADLPPGVMCVDYAPYGLLLPRARATVHHGGIGTTAQALRAGKPTVILPHAHDQFDNAARAERLGVSATLVRGHHSPHALARALTRVIDDRGVLARAADLGRRIAAEDGARRAAEAVETVASGRPAREPIEATVGPGPDR
ncbi:MAG TPA: hypothetical protein DEB06_04735 [Phycisphaerales bacterium]|nr:hypothetical protein [Phycisphaerales bacterium]